MGHVADAGDGEHVVKLARTSIAVLDPRGKAMSAAVRLIARSAVGGEDEMGLTEAAQARAERHGLIAGVSEDEKSPRHGCYIAFARGGAGKNLLRPGNHWVLSQFRSKDKGESYCGEMARWKQGNQTFRLPFWCGGHEE